MRKEEKIKALFDPAVKNILLTDYLAGSQLRNETMNYLGIHTEKEMLDLLGVDFYYLSCRDISQNESCLLCYKGPPLVLKETERICPFGIRFKREVRNDKFSVDEAMKGPFEKDGVTEQGILDYPWPEPEWFDFSALSSECDSFPDKIIVGGLWSGIHGDSTRMMGFENFLINIAMNKSLVKVLVDRMTKFYLELNRKYFDVVKDKMDIFFMGNDFGSQNGLLISEQDWVEIYYENYKKLIDLAHDYGFKVMVHSCGGIEPLLPYFIELGVDLLDPVQITAKGMDPELLGRKYGGKIVFHGAVDTQKILPFGTPSDVYEHCLYLIESLNTNGNFVVAPSNNFMIGTPPENILQVYKAVKDYRNENNFQYVES